MGYGLGRSPFFVWAMGLAFVRDLTPSSYHLATMLKIYIYGYLNRVQSSRRLEHETQRNVELMWLLGRLTPV
jgi:transposase|tara:strand:- start:4791 stop:5006 length:216 start_codon:yes stop_codon:yes gene_type:complete